MTSKLTFTNLQSAVSLLSLILPTWHPGRLLFPNLTCTSTWRSKEEDAWHVFPDPKWIYAEAQKSCWPLSFDLKLKSFKSVFTGFFLEIPQVGDWQALEPEGQTLKLGSSIHLRLAQLIPFLSLCFWPITWTMTSFAMVCEEASVSWVQLVPKSWPHTQETHSTRWLLILHPKSVDIPCALQGSAPR